MDDTPTYTFDANAARMERVFVSISGLIGAGKSTLATALAKRLNLPIFYEPVQENSYLQEFYGDMKRYSFPMQIYLLNKRFSQQQQIVWSGKGGVQDRTIYEDSVFAKMLRDSGLMEERDYQTYLDLFNHMANFMRKPNIIVHLDVSPEESLRRIRMRERDCEKGITLEYLTNLYDAYEEFIRDISRVIPVIRVDYNSFRTVEEMANRIAREYSRIANVRYIEWSDSPGSPSCSAGARTPCDASSPAVGAGNTVESKHSAGNTDATPAKESTAAGTPTSSPGDSPISPNGVRTMPSLDQSISSTQPGSMLSAISSDAAE